MSRELHDARHRVAVLEATLRTVRELIDGIAHEIGDDNTAPADHAEINGCIVLARQTIDEALADVASTAKSE